ncbi:unnamed protein product [Phytophthora lilii]|uniref:Unnamed protein product n=1 Tax=Phytophthora lilii TaxID=2077276 RepID=A0A9W7CQF4_9STRA|nr:unnamed protein product [Phytophthora lilii]
MSNQALQFSHIQAKLIGDHDNGIPESHRTPKINQRGATLFPRMKHIIRGFQISEAILLLMNMAKCFDAIVRNGDQCSKLNRRLLREQVSSTPSKERHHDNMPLLVFSISVENDLRN